MAFGHEVGRHDARAVARVDARLLDVLHDAPDDDGPRRIGHGIDVEFERVLQELVDEHRPFRRCVDRFGDVPIERRQIVDNRHRAPAEHVRRTDDDRKADRGGDGPGLLARGGNAARGLRHAEIPQQAREAVAVLGQVDRIGRRAQNVHAGVLQRQRELQRRLAAELHEARHLPAGRPLALDDGEDILERQRLEVEPIDRVVVGRHRLRIAVDHDGLEPLLPERERRVTAAVVEFETLADPVGAAAENDDLRPVGRVGLALTLVGAVLIGRERLEFRGAGVDPLVDRPEPGLPPPLEHGGGVRAGDCRDIGVAEPGTLERRQEFRRHVAQPDQCGLASELDEFLELAKEPPVDPCDLVHLLDRPPALQRSKHRPQAAVGGHGQLALERRVVLGLPRRLREQPARPSQLERSEPLEEALLERPADGHDLAHRLHLGRERRVGLGELLERPARNLDDHVVDRRLERRRSQAGDVVGNLVQVITQRELRGDLRDREARRLRRERRRSGDARIHLDRHDPPVLRMHRELDVRPAGFDAHPPDDPPGDVTQPLILLVGQRQGRRDRDAIARVHAHRVDVLDRADHDEVVRRVPHHFQLELFPSDDRLLEQNFVDGTEAETAIGHLAELFHVVGDATSHAAECERRPDDHREPERLDRSQRFVERLDVGARRNRHVDRVHRFPELQTIFRNLDRLDRCPDEFDPVSLERAALAERHGQVERRLTPDGREQRVRSLAFDDLGHDLRGERLDVGAVGDLRVGHDRRRIAVDEHDLEPLGAQRLARLRA